MHKINLTDLGTHIMCDEYEINKKGISYQRVTITPALDPELPPKVSNIQGFIAEGLYSLE